MRIFIYEYTCAVRRNHHPRMEPLRGEGWAMLSAVLADFARLPGVEVLTLLGEPREVPAGVHVHRNDHSHNEVDLFRKLAKSAHYSLIIAPELDSLLFTRCRWLEEAGGRLLGPSSLAVRFAADKLILARHLQQHGVPSPPCSPYPPGPLLPGISFPAVCKPRFGAGSTASYLIQTPEDLLAAVASAEKEGFPGEMIVQSFVPGFPASLAFLMGPKAALPLCPAAQRLTDDGRFRYLGGWLPLPAELAERALALAELAVKAVPGLRGYIGVDLVLGAAADGSQDWVIEINPRLTTSYVGLRALAETNLADAWLSVATGQEPPHLSWHAGRVEFQAGGQLQVCC